ncbi:MAG: zinc ribbon domain-containing protein [Candidatus Marinimicrobia bacterium]|nr:FmdB family transcriptional regulator [Candidatus Neomarinimicrobiota bacterium]MDP6500121.1 zinc ribbon domain-containing protein [Candidatus Neomarinimicrobiota bacterium]MDP6726475.1 zinc ribbon domain-containing protein [Candidatus Neomarinimicrobiota bacterium]
MPSYDYICKKCGHTFELFQSMSDSPRKTCPVCKGVVRRLVSGGSGLIFKGSGFYLTDYKNGKKDPKDKKETKNKEKPKKIKKEQN